MLDLTFCSCMKFVVRNVKLKSTYFLTPTVAELLDQAYLTVRSKCVSTDGVKSDFLYITKGVPQGSILDPVLFTVYISHAG